MKDLVFTNAQATFAKEYKTDLLDGWDNFTVHDIKVTSPSGTVTEDDLIRAGISFEHLPYTKVAFEAFATANNLNLNEIDYSGNSNIPLVSGASDDLDITTAALAGGNNGIAYTDTLESTGGFPEYTYSIVSGTLQAGLSLDSRTGIISGIPTETSANPITFRVTDLSGQVNDQALTLTISA